MILPKNSGVKNWPQEAKPIVSIMVGDFLIRRISRRTGNGPDPEEWRLEGLSISNGRKYLNRSFISIYS